MKLPKKLGFQEVSEELGLQDEEMVEREISEPYSEINSDFYRLKLETHPTLARIYENWLRVEWDPDEQKLIKMANQEPIINERGARDCLTVLIDIVNKENIQGNLDDDYIRITAIELANNISNLLFMNHELYEITNPINCAIIVDDCATIIYATLTRALNAGERNSLKPVAEVKETIMQQNQQKKKNMLAGIFEGGKE